MSKRKRGVPDRAVVQDYVEFYNFDLYYDVKDEWNLSLFSMPKRAIQRMSRDVVGRVIGRCKESKPVGLLLPSNVPVRDHRAFLPEVDIENESKYYARRLEIFFKALYGTKGQNLERDDFYLKLKALNLNFNLRQMESLYFHIFLLNEEERADFPLEAVTNLRNRHVRFGGISHKWSVAYTDWHHGRPKEVFNLKQSCQNAYWVHQVYRHKYKTKYPDTCIGEAELARNIIIHINERREKAKPPLKSLLDKCRIGYVLYKVVPKLNMKLFDFMWDCLVDMDFHKFKDPIIRELRWALAVRDAVLTPAQPDKCWAGICLLGVTCQECSSDRFLASYSVWYQKLLSPLQSPTTSQFVKVASCASMSDLLTRLGEFPIVRKDGTAFAGKLIQSVLKLIDDDHSEIVWVSGICVRLFLKDPKFSLRNPKSSWKDC